MILLLLFTLATQIADQEHERIILQEHRLTVIETRTTAIDERLSAIEKIGYGLVASGLIQIFLSVKKR